MPNGAWRHESEIFFPLPLEKQNGSFPLRGSVARWHGVQVVGTRR